MTVSKFFNRVQFNASSGGSGAYRVDSAVAGYRTPAQAGIPDGTLVSYVAFITSGNGANATITDWETGQGTYTSANTSVSRTTVRESSLSNGLVSFSKAPTVFLDLHAQDAYAVPFLDAFIHDHYGGI